MAEQWRNCLEEAAQRLRAHVDERPVRFDARDRSALQFVLDHTEGKCRGCHQPLVTCPHCSGSDDTDDAGRGQGGGYLLCQDEKCPEYQFCCGC